MMTKLVQIDFPFSGPFGEEMTAAMGELAQSITREPGFLWKIWTENHHTQEAGGIYLFRDEDTATAYIKKHTERLQGFGITGINAKVFDVNDALTRINHGPV